MMTAPDFDPQTTGDSQASPTARKAVGSASPPPAAQAELHAVRDVQAWLEQEIWRPLSAEPVPVTEAAGRVLAESIVSPVSVPPFRRAMMDGLVVHATDIAAATPSTPVGLQVLGTLLPGDPAPPALARRTTYRVMTGAAVPAEASAVVPIEQTTADPQGQDRVFVLQAAAPQKHIGRVGEDIQAGQEILPAGRRLRPQDVGLLSAIALAKVSVVRRPRAHVIVTGQELLPPGSQPTGTQIVDSNSPMLAALLTRDGAADVRISAVGDDPQAIAQALLAEADVTLVSGGSSVGVADHAPALLRQHGELHWHGLALRPGRPAGVGRIAGRPVFLLPGNPVACLCVYDFFAGPTVRAYGGRSIAWPYPRRRFPLRHKLTSAEGRVDYARVRLVSESGALPQNTEIPMFVDPLAVSGASNLSSTTRADGFIVVPAEAGELPAGEAVEVFLYDG